MAQEYTITANNNIQLFRDVSFKSAAKTYQFDFSPWAEANNTVTSVTWETKTGNAGITGQALSSNIATALITFSEPGGNLIKLTADTGTEIYVVYLDVFAKDPEQPTTNDYGFCL